MDKPTIEQACKLADQDCPLPALAGPALKVLREALCYHRCKRIHPHCQLRLTRDVAPDSGWHWAVGMPDGHLYDVSHGRMTFEPALVDMQKRGVVALDAADVIWREAHSDMRAHTTLCVGEIRAIGRQMQREGERLQSPALAIEELVRIGRRYGMRLTPHIEPITTDPSESAEAES